MKPSVRAALGKQRSSRAAFLLPSCAVLQVECLQRGYGASAVTRFLKASVPLLNCCFLVLGWSAAAASRVSAVLPGSALLPTQGRDGSRARDAPSTAPAPGALQQTCPDEMTPLKFVMPAAHLLKSENVYTKDCGLID